MNGPDPARQDAPTTRMTWTLSPDKEPDAAPITFKLRCISEDENGSVCGAEGPRDRSPDVAHAWAFEHAVQEPSHRSFYDLVEMPYVLSPSVEPGPLPSKLYPPEH